MRKRSQINQNLCFGVGSFLQGFDVSLVSKFLAFGCCAFGGLALFRFAACFA